MIKLLCTMQGKVVKIRDAIFAIVFNILVNILVSRDFIYLENKSLNGEMGKFVKDIMEFGSTPNASDFYFILAPSNYKD